MSPSPSCSKPTERTKGSTTVMRLAFAALTTAVGCGCVNSVVPPEAPASPTPAFLLDHGQHASIVIPDGQGLARYTYGEWDYYVAGDKGPLRASATLFGSNRAGVGRRSLEGPPDVANVRRQALVRIEHAWRIDAPAKRVAELRRHFDRLFASQGGTHTHNERYDLDFVRHPAPYHMANNSNHMVGRWLRTLGCGVTMRTPFSVWSVHTEARDDAAR